MKTVGTLVGCLVALFLLSPASNALAAGRGQTHARAADIVICTGTPMTMAEKKEADGLYHVLAAAKAVGCSETVIQMNLTIWIHMYHPVTNTWSVVAEATNTARPFFTNSFVTTADKSCARTTYNYTFYATGIATFTTEQGLTKATPFASPYYQFPCIGS